MRICEKFPWMGGGRREGEGGRLAAAPAQDHALEEEVQENRKDGACTLRPL